MKSTSFEKTYNEDVNSQYYRTTQFVLESLEKRVKLVACFVLLAVLSTIFTHFFYLPSYEAKSVIRVKTEQTVSVAGVLAFQQGLTGYATESREMNRFIRYLESESFLIAVAQNIKFDPQFASLDLADPKKIFYFSPKYWKRYFSSSHSAIVGESEQNSARLKGVSTSNQELLGKIAPLVRIMSDNMELITISVNSLDPKTSMVIANAYADELAKMNQQKDTQELVEVEKYIREKLAEVTESLKKSENEMVKVQERNHLTSGEGNGVGMSSQLKDIEGKVAQLSVQKAENERVLRYYRDSASGADGGINAKEIHDFRVSELTRKNIDIEEQKVSLSMLAAKAEEKFSKLPKAEQEYFRLKRQQQLDYDLYSTLVQKISQIEILKFSVFKKVTVDAPAREGLPAQRVNFFLKLLFALFSSLFFAVLVTLGAEWLDPTVKSVDDLVEARIEKIGIVPKIETNQAIAKIFGKRNSEELQDRNLTRMLVTRSNPKSIESMSFKYIRARLQKNLDSNGNPAKTILVTSASSGDGKSFIACNLAISFAQLGKRTLLVDCDFRHPSINRYFGIPNRKGLASILKMEHSLDEVTVQDTVVPTLHILPADWGVEDPTELLSDENLLVLLDHLKSEYDYIIIDSPPIQMVVDGLILSSVVSTVLVVGRYRKTLKTLLSKTYRDLINVSFQKVYGILNDTEQSRLLQFFGHHSHHYGYGYGSNKYYTKEDVGGGAERNQETS